MTFESLKINGLATSGKFITRNVYKILSTSILRVSQIYLYRSQFLQLPVVGPCLSLQCVSTNSQLISISNCIQTAPGDSISYITSSPEERKLIEKIHFSILQKKARAHHFFMFQFLSLSLFLYFYLHLFFVCC